MYLKLGHFSSGFKLAYSFLWLKYKNNILAIFHSCLIQSVQPPRVKNNFVHPKTTLKRIWVKGVVFLEKSQMKTLVVLYTNNTKDYFKKKEHKNNIHYQQMKLICYFNYKLVYISLCCVKNQKKGRPNVKLSQSLKIPPPPSLLPKSSFRLCFGFIPYFSTLGG